VVLGLLKRRGDLLTAAGQISLRNRGQVRSPLGRIRTAPATQLKGRLGIEKGFGYDRGGNFYLST
jgi:hypothetical protein